MDSQAKEEREARDVEVPLGPEESHVVLHLHIQMLRVFRAMRMVLDVRRVFSHLPDGICNTMNY